MIPLGGYVKFGLIFTGLAPNGARPRVKARHPKAQVGDPPGRRPGRSNKGGKVRLDSPVQYLKGVGPKRAEALGRLGVERVGDLLTLFPRRYLDASTVTPIREVQLGQVATVVGRIVTRSLSRTRRGTEILTVVVDDGTSYLECRWFNQGYLKDRFRPGEQLFVHGPIREYAGRYLQPAEFQVLSEGDGRAGTILPIYPATEGLHHKAIRQFVARVLETTLPQVEEILPGDVRERLGLPERPAALQEIHFPTTVEAREAARRRLAFEELLLVQLALLRRRAESEARTGIAFPINGQLTTALEARLPFKLTRDQRRVRDEIWADMVEPRPMHRLLQGEVGSGKTIVALFAMLRAVEHGYQAALMAPTEVLADQHARTLAEQVAPLGLQVAHLSRGVVGQERVSTLEAIRSGASPLVVGTHALIQEPVEFRRLGLVVVDEQHRFGVAQRARLREKGEGAWPDVLVMTATPIPRSLALTLYGDLDVSTIRELPPGRTPPITRVLIEAERRKLYQFLRAKGREEYRAYVILPVVEAPEETDLRAATEAAERLAQAFPELSVGLLHGQLSSAEKERIMARFEGGDLDILVATTVVEVGIDVPAARILIVEHAERFGLAQLHQLRGRVGRGAGTSYCFLVLSPEAGPEARERLQILAETADGFAVAETDLRLRGAGDLWGRRQHGMPEFKVADLFRDGKLIELARREARGLLRKDPELADAAHRSLRGALERFMAQSGEVYDIG